MNNLISKRGVRNLNILVPRNARVVCDVKKTKTEVVCQDGGGHIGHYWYRRVTILPLFSTFLFLGF